MSAAATSQAIQLLLPIARQLGRAAWRAARALWRRDLHDMLIEELAWVEQKMHDWEYEQEHGNPDADKHLDRLEERREELKDALTKY